MVRQGALQFPSPVETVQVNAASNEPRVWVRRLVIWAKPEEIIRDISLRRGLNIVYSADPGSNDAILGQKGGSGHGVGKTLFCRLLRYCLGEDTFAHDDFRRDVQGYFPEGLVGAEVIINGKLWSVIRPIGTTRKHIAKSNVNLGNLITEASDENDISPYFDALNALISDAVDNHIPGGHNLKRWLFALAFLSRDQENRFSHLLDWRHSDADTRSPVRDTSVDQRNIIIRYFLNIMSDEEVTAQTQRDALSQKKSTLTQSTANLGRSTEYIATEISLGLSQNQDSNSEPLQAATLQKIALDNLKSKDNAYENTAMAQAIDTKRAELEELIVKKGPLTNDFEKFDGLIALQKDQISVLRGEKANLDADAIKARLGETCPVCSVPIDDALAEGCGLSHVIRDPQTIEKKTNETAAKITACEQAILRYEQLKSSNDVAIKNIDKQIAEVRRQIQNLEEQMEQGRKNQRQKWFEAKTIHVKAEQLIKDLERLEEERRELRNIPEKEKQCNETLQRLRLQHSSIMTRLQELFLYVSQGFLGDGNAKLALTGKGIQAQVITGGTAMETLKVLAFDLATMFMSIEGKTLLPTFLIHDSPREGDLGESIYQRLFHFLCEIENLEDEPPFQYIVTTTSAPPTKFITDPYLILSLDGNDDQNRLLKISL